MTVDAPSPNEILKAAGAQVEQFMPAALDEPPDDELNAPPPDPFNVQTAAPPDGKRGRAFGKLRVLSIQDALNAPKRQHLLGGLIGARELSLWWGAPKCGKSFLLLRLAYGLALGQGMWGRKAKRCRVLYVAAEGEGGFAARLVALRSTMGDAGDFFHYIAQRVSIGEPSEQVDELINAAKATRAKLIIIDTLARTFGVGDENSAQSMNAYVEKLDLIRAATWAHVAVVHHSTKEGSSSRGSGALVGAADLIVKITRGTDKQPNRAFVEAAKDDVDGASLAFNLQTVDLETGPDGEPRRTCIAEDAEAAPSPKKALTTQTETALRFLNDLIAKVGKPLPQGIDWPSAKVLGISKIKWAQECESRGLSMSEKPQDRTRIFRKAAGELLKRGIIAMRDDWVWIVRADELDG
jgi:hypothetical protein